jgi:hypothetical protein
MKSGYSDKELAKLISDKCKQNVQYAEIAKHAYNTGRPVLAARVLFKILI